MGPPGLRRDASKGRFAARSEAAREQLGGKSILAGGREMAQQRQEQRGAKQGGLQGSERWRPSEAAEPRGPGLAAVPLHPRRITLAAAGEQVKGTQEDIMNLGSIPREEI